MITIIVMISNIDGYTMITFTVTFKRWADVKP